MINKSIIKFLSLLIMCIPLCASSQMSTDYQVLQRTEEAKKLMEGEHFGLAYTSFRKILNSGKVLPTNLSYYFAETLYHIGQYQNSKNFTDKYLKITGKGGDYYQEATELSKLLSSEFDKISSCLWCDVSGYRLITCTHCHGVKSVVESCHICTTGITNCKKCEGEGVLIVTDVFDDKKYQTCDKCHGEGYHTCETCLGTTTLQLNCPVCLGSGLEKSEVICDHEEHDVN